MIFLTPDDSIKASISAGTASAHVSFHDANISALNADKLNDMAGASNQETALAPSSMTTICTAPSAKMRRAVGRIYITNTGAVTMNVSVEVLVSSTAYLVAYNVPVAVGQMFWVGEDGLGLVP